MIRSDATMPTFVESSALGSLIPPPLKDERACALIMMAVREDSATFKDKHSFREARDLRNDRERGHRLD